MKKRILIGFFMLIIASLPLVACTEGNDKAETLTVGGGKPDFVAKISSNDTWENKNRAEKLEVVQKSVNRCEEMKSNKDYKLSGHFNEKEVFAYDSKTNTVKIIEEVIKDEIQKN